MKALFLTAFLLLSALPALAADAPPHSPPAIAAAKRLRREGFRQDFIELIQRSYDESARDDIVALNVLGFLSKPADYEKHFSPKAVKETLAFLKENNSTLQDAKRRHGVDPEIIASLLWVETKLGKQLGSNSVAGAYYSLVQADHPTVMKATLETLASKVGKVTRAFRRKVRERSKAKVKWAIEELRSLAKIRKKDSEAPIDRLKGSFAGAFGYPQFIATAYYRFARSADAKSRPDLFQTGDAIHSVAYYLKMHGYRSRSVQAQRRALFGYNRATGYVDVILKLADCIRREEPTLSDRKLASRSARGSSCQ